MSESRSDLIDFKRIVDVYGTNPDRWPDKEKIRMEHILENSQEAEVYIQEESWLDEIIEDTVFPEISPVVYKNILKETKENSIFNFMKDCFQLFLLKPEYAVFVGMFLGFFSGSIIFSEEQSISENTAYINYAYNFAQTELYEEYGYEK